MPRTRSVFLSRPLVSFCFDDFPRSALVGGGRVLEALGVRATYYAAMRFLNGDTDFGDGFTLADLETLTANGHELGCHTFDHLSAAAASPVEYEASVLRNRDVIARLLPGASVETFAYPYGVCTPEAIAVACRHSRCARSTVGGANVHPLRRYELRANKLYSRRVPLQATKDLIRESRQTGAWLIFYAHDVAPDPSPYGCHPDYLQEVVAFAVESGAMVLPVRSALSLAEAAAEWP